MPSSQHLLDECSKKNEYVECNKCQDAVIKNDLIPHQNGKQCIPAANGKVSLKFSDEKNMK